MIPHCLLTCLPCLGHKVLHASCRKPSLGLAIKSRGCKVAGQEGSMGVQESEGIDPHTPKGTPILGVGVPMESRMFRK
jgi:hypothetical protein